MTTEKQILANQQNAENSTGPSTPAGLAKSSQNSLRHGMLAETVVLDGESRNRFKELLSSLEAEWQPQSVVESSLVENMTVARWRQMRLWSMERAGLSREMRRQESIAIELRADSGVNAQNDPPTDDAATLAALAFRHLADNSRSLDVMHRYETRFDRQYDRSLRRLMALREKRNLPNEPILQSD